MFDTTPVEVEIVFDETNPNWNRPEYNLFFLRASQNYLNDLLANRGHLFLNDVLDVLSIRRTAQGAIGGWLSGVNGGFVDLGLTELINSLGETQEATELRLKVSIIPSMYDHI